MKQIASPRAANGSRPPAAHGSRPPGSNGSGPPASNGSAPPASAALERRLHRIEARLEGLDRTLTAFDELANTALPAVLERFETTLREQGSEADASFAARLEALDDVAQVLVRRASALERLEASLAEREEELGRRAAAADERAARLEDIDARLHERGRELSEAVGEVERIAETRLPAVLADAETTLQERAQTVTAALSAHVTAAERAARHLDERTERLGRVEEALQGRVTDLERAGAVLTERLGRLRQATDTVEYGGTELTEHVECLDRVIDPLVDVASRIEAGMTAAVREGVAGFVDEATEAPPSRAPEEADLPEEPDAPEQWVYWDETEGWVPWEDEDGAPTADEDGHDAQGWAYWDEAEGWVYRAEVETGEDPGAPDGREPRQPVEDAGPQRPSRVLVRPGRRTVPAALRCDTGDVAVADVAGDDDGPPLTEQELLEARRERELGALQELRARLLGVPGVGARRAQLIADAYGDLDTLVHAEADDVVAATGLPGSVAAEVVAHLRR